MKITCNLNIYGKRQDTSDFIKGDYWMINNPFYEVEYRLEIETVPSKDYSSTLLASKPIVKTKDPTLMKMEYIAFHSVSYVYLYAQNRIYCTTLEQKI